MVCSLYTYTEEHRSQLIIHSILLRAAFSIPAFLNLPLEADWRNVWAVDPRRIGEVVSPTWIAHAKRTALFFLQPIDTCDDLVAEKFGFRVFACDRLLDIVAHGLGIAVDMLLDRLILSRYLEAQDFQPDDANRFADLQLDDANRYADHIAWVLSESTEDGTLCTRRLYPLGHQRCLPERGDCLNEWELRLFSDFLKNRHGPLRRGPAELIAVRDDQLNDQGASSVRNLETMLHARFEYRIGRYDVAEQCELPSDRVVVLWALAAIRIASRRARKLNPDSFNPIFSMSWSLFNVGAGDGVGYDPLSPLLSSNFTGAWVEADAAHIKQLRSNVGERNGRHVFHLILTPDNVFEVLERAGLHFLNGSLDILKVDIDSYDCDIVEAILSEGIVPKLIWLEINWSVPPPLRYARHFDPQSQQTGLGTPMIGCSLSYSVHLMHSYGYDLFLIENADAVFLHRKLSSWITSKLVPRVPLPNRMGFFDCPARPPLDEFTVFHSRRFLQTQLPLQWIREWFYDLPPTEALDRLGKNLTMWTRQNKTLKWPFTLEI